MTETATNGRVEITQEPLTYRSDADYSYFQDIVRQAAQPDSESRGAQRLKAHAAEMRTVSAEQERRAWQTADRMKFDLRVNPSRLDGQGGYASPPLWLMDAIATVPRPGRVLAALMPSFPLPQGIGEVNIPRLTTGTQAAIVVDNAAPTSRDVTDAAVTSPVVTVAGQSDMALQLLEQSPPGGYLDHVIFKDLAASYDGHLERQLINGSGMSGQLLGVLNVPTGVFGSGLATLITYTDASPTAPELYPFLGQAVAQLGDARLLPPEVWLMRTAREAWILFAQDTAGMPLSPPGHMPTPTVPFLFDDQRPTQGAAIGTYPVYRDDAVPATLGAGTQDAIVLCRPSDMLLLESAPRTLVDFESQSGTLGVRLQLRAYVAALVARYPTGIASVQGTGMAVQSGY
jgi:HK97 family phage major capsid protein